MQRYSWETVKKEQLNDNVWRKVVNGERITLAQIGIAKGGIVPTHHHENEQISLVIRGSVKFEMEGKEIIVQGGEVLHIPSNVPHRVTALEDTLAMDVFSPVRTDWMTGTDDYFRKKS